MVNTHQVKHHTLVQRKVITRLLTGFLMFASGLSGTAHPSADPAVISYKQNSQENRTLIFLNNPEYLWSNRFVCDLADDGKNHAGQACENSLFQLSELHEGRYRVWWEHRNMMPAIVQSAIVLENTGSRAATVELAGTHLETNSKKNGGREWAALFNSTRLPQTKTISPGERVILSDASNQRIFPGHYFAGVSDFSIRSGSIMVNEVVFRKGISRNLKPSIYDTRDHFGVHESLVYKGISTVSSVQLTGAQFTIDDTTSKGPLPVSYQRYTLNPLDQERGLCDASQRPVCSGASLIPAPELSSDTSWVTHIAPDPFDSNPKRSRAIVDDLIELTLPASTLACPSVWPMPTGSSAQECIRMSSQYQWYLPDFSRWRLPNWGNWAVHYSHPVTITNTGEHPRSIRLVITADGDSPVAFRGSGVTTQWQQRFLTKASPNQGRAALILAQGEIAPGTTETLMGEFVLAGPAAGTLEHRIEIYE